MKYIYHHLKEMKLRFIYSLVTSIFTLSVSYLYKYELLYLITRPFLELQQKFIFLDLTEALYTIIRICCFITLILLVFHILYQIWSFLIPSCYLSERRLFNKFIIVFIILLSLEVSCIYFLLFPKIVEFFSSFQIHNPLSTIKSLSPLSTIKSLSSSQIEETSTVFHKNNSSLLVIELQARIESYVRLIIRISILILILFQIPLLFMILYYNRLCNVYQLSSNRKIVFFFCILFSAFISPPDILSQCLIFSLFLFLFEFLIVLGLIFHYSSPGLNSFKGSLSFP